MAQKYTQEQVQEILAKVEKTMGHVPLVNQVLSESPDMFFPVFQVGNTLLKPKADLELEPKTRYLIALASAAAMGGEHCVRLQMNNALRAGASREEILETITIASYMCMTKSQSYSYRIFQDIMGENKEEE